ncbi:hypothetical protein DPMN_103905 [Dreissena polymorpha]|uniref:Uncharacterized protein n=1 Tax=Dreissena polymorpha TaxID=45954 RepID=A0A9D4K171_DREPO|nr:hypothetical protein DPMN_103905 [Dreissena polymorpha]
MGILNLGLQNCALERNVTEDEDKFKSCGSMAQIRDAIRKTPELKRTWESTIQPVQQIVKERFQRLTLKDTPFRTPEPVQ